MLKTVDSSDPTEWLSYELRPATGQNPGRRTTNGTAEELWRELCRCSAMLLRTLGGSEITTVVQFVAASRTRWNGHGGYLPGVVLEEARQLLLSCGLRLRASELKPSPEDRLAALLWSTHGALPPSVSEIVVLRGLCCADHHEAARVLGIRERTAEALIGRAARRSRALGLDRVQTGPIELQFGIKAAEERLQILRNRVGRRAEDWARPLELALDDWLAVAGAALQPG